MIKGIEVTFPLYEMTRNPLQKQTFLRVRTAQENLGTNRSLSYKWKAGKFLNFTKKEVNPALFVFLILNMNEQ